ncbi:Ubiquitin carboxyl-terminal hydrolase 45 [Harpegnathos saltator]|uniref:Ubiquitin carboxyl-terminal hydrolase 45 n=1 Tax=Harpegnathos saltator TaxID=610380 RepID=E2BQF9_HARSA|nr:Ubiquitin carboxyl-terminal hydrolase 45 [Harpegnathos saltator]
MSKKRNRQPDVNAEVSEASTESCEEASTVGAKCPHIAKAINLTKVKKNIKKTGIDECSMCKKLELDFKKRDEQHITRLLWVCLQCGELSCGKEEGQHALNHYKRPHSDCHCMVADTYHWNVWCYQCDVEEKPLMGTPGPWRGPGVMPDSHRLKLLGDTVRRVLCGGGRDASALFRPDRRAGTPLSEGSELEMVVDSDLSRPFRVVNPNREIRATLVINMSTSANVKRPPSFRKACPFGLNGQQDATVRRTVAKYTIVLSSITLEATESLLDE